MKYFTEDKHMAFLASFLQYVIIMIILVGIAICGVLVGKALRKRKDKKDALAEEAVVATEGDVTNE
jgi:NADH:ubiquinone oxidoreductase subunit 3 (subunit A)